MSTQVSTYDVFLSYSLTEGETAELVERALTEAGFGVISRTKAEPGTSIRKFVWKGLAESDALVAIIDPQRNLPSSTGVEVGAAVAWQKPVYVVHTETGNFRLPRYLEDFPTYSISRIDDVVQSIMRGLRPLSEKERSVLCDAYVDLGIPTDQLLMEPASIEKLAHDFNSRSGKNASGESLLQELIRLRKSRRLPRLGRRTR